MNAKEELLTIARIEAAIEGKLEHIKRLEARAMKTTSEMGGESVSRTRDTDIMGKYMVEKERLEKEVAMLQAQNKRRKIFFSRIIDNLTNPMHIKVLYGIYYNGKKAETIAEENNYSYRHIFNLRDDGVAEVQKIVEKQNVSFIS